MQLEAPAALDAAVAEVIVATLLLAEHQGAFELLEDHVLEFGSRDNNEDVDYVFAHEAGYRGAAYMFDGEVGDSCEREVEGELFFNLLKGGGPCFLIFVDQDFHAGEALSEMLTVVCAVFCRLENV